MASARPTPPLSQNASHWGCFNFSEPSYNRRMKKSTSPPPAVVWPGGSRAGGLLACLQRGHPRARADARDQHAGPAARAVGGLGQGGRGRGSSVVAARSLRLSLAGARCSPADHLQLHWRGERVLVLVLGLGRRHTCRACRAAPCRGTRHSRRCKPRWAPTPCSQTCGMAHCQHPHATLWLLAAQWSRTRPRAPQKTADFGDTESA